MRKNTTIPSTTTEHLVRLIKSLTKAEKRSFKIYSQRVGGDNTALFIQLFDVLDKQTTYDEEGIFQKVPGIKRSQLSNLKRHLYRQILTSLRLIHIPKNIDIQIREQIDFARVLYNKGHYRQSLKLLDKVKAQARSHHQDALHLEIVEFEKLIESRHITRSIENRAGELALESEHRHQVVSNTTRLSNLALKLYSLFVKSGHVKNQHEALYVREFFKSNLPELNFDKLTFYERVYYCQCYCWYYYIVQNFPLYFKYTQKWVDQFEEYEGMKDKDPELYLRGLHNLLTSLFYSNQYGKFQQVLKQLEGFILHNADDFDTNLEVQAFSYLYTAKINKHYLEGSFTDGLFLVAELEQKLALFEDHLDPRRILIFYYKIACLYFGSGDNGRTIDHLNNIINYKAGTLVSDIQCYARILHLIAHFELGHFALLEYLVKSVYRFLAKMEDLNVVQREILYFLRKELRTNPAHLQHAFIQLKNKLGKLKDHPSERRSFLYLDIISWLESKIQNRPVQEVIREKFEKRRR